MAVQILRNLENYANNKLKHAEKSAGAVAVFRLSSLDYQCYGMSGFDGTIERQVYKQIKKIPRKIRQINPWFGYCAEIDCFNKTFKKFPRLKTLKGGEVWAMNVGRRKAEQHGDLKPACCACLYVAKQLEVECKS